MWRMGQSCWLPCSEMCTTRKISEVGCVQCVGEREGVLERRNRQAGNQTDRRTDQQNDRLTV